jgi:signal transduction histidine kinase
MLSPVGRELGEIRTSSGRKSAPDGDLTLRSEVDERLEAVRRRLLSVQDFVADLAAIGESDPQEVPREVDLAEAVRAEVRALEGRAFRAGVEVVVRGPPDESHASARVAPRSLAVLARATVAHAVGASPRGSQVVVTVHAPSDGQGSRFMVDDAGTILPAVARRALLALEVEPGTFGRPSGVGLFAASEVAAAQGGRLEVSDAPSGGLRVSVVFPP